MAETAKLITLLSNPQVTQFIDFQKLKASNTLNEIAVFAVEHVLTSRDSTYISKVLGIFKHTKDFDRLLKWFCLRAGLESTVNDGQLKFKKSEMAPNTELELLPFLNSMTTAPQTIKKSLSRVAKSTLDPVAKKKKKKLKKVDLLDSRAMLPGSYGSGKRR